MLRYTVLVVIGLLAGSARGQQAAPGADTAATSSSLPASIQPSKTVLPMEEPQPGDYWTYEIRDEITGKISATRTNVITDVTPKEINTRVDTLGNSNPGQIIFDRAWNMLTSGSWRFSPNDGTGIQSPLTMGKTWNFQSNGVNGANGFGWKRSGKSKVIGQETVTTKAGTFETLKIETSYAAQSVNDPTKKSEVTSETWYAPAIDHWVKRTFVSRTDKHLMINNTLELVEYGRKQ
jgi:hypothetical protein